MTFGARLRTSYQVIKFLSSLRAHANDLAETFSLGTSCKIQTTLRFINTPCRHFDTYFSLPLFSLRYRTVVLQKSSCSIRQKAARVTVVPISSTRVNARLNKGPGSRLQKYLIPPHRIYGFAFAVIKDLLGPTPASSASRHQLPAQSV